MVLRLLILRGVILKMDAYTAEALIELGTELLKEDEDRAELHFMGDDLYDLAHIDMDEVYKHFEDMGYDCYMVEEVLIDYSSDNYDSLGEPMKTLVITK